MSVATSGVPTAGDDEGLGAARLSLLADVAELAMRGSSVEAFFSALNELLSGNAAAECILIWLADTGHGPEYSAAGPGWTRISPEQVLARTESWLRDRRQEGSGTGEAEEAFPESQPIRVMSPSLEAYDMGLALLDLACLEGGNLRILVGSEQSPQTLNPGSIQFFRALAGILGSALDRIRSEAEKTIVQRQVLEAKRHWEATVDALPQLIAVLDLSGRVVRVNRAVEKWSLGSVRTSKGVDLHRLLHPECRSADCPLEACWKQLWAQLKTDGSGMAEIRDPLTGAELELSLARNRSQGPPGFDSGYAFVVVDDVSDRRRAERMLEFFNRELKHQVDEKTAILSGLNRKLEHQIEEHVRDKALLRATQERYACLVENTLIGIYLVKGHRIRFANRRFGEIFGYSNEELEELDIRSLVPSVDLMEAAETGGSGDPEQGIFFQEQVVQGRCRDGARLWLQVSNAPVRRQQESLILGNVMDITAQVEGELELRESEREQQRLSAQLVSAQEEERLRIASELHDGIGQNLSVIKLGIENVVRGLGGGLAQRDQQNFDNLISMIRLATEEVRRISMDLHPAMLEDLGLAATIDWFCREYRKVLPEIEITKRIKFDEREWDAEQKLAAFRILQEAFNNIAKHARAKRIDLALRKAKGSIKLTIRDDGEGFGKDSKSASRPGFGLRSMKQRAQLTGGRISVKSRPGRGTIVRAEWPAEGEPEDAEFD